jgi:hypothetical protein
MSDATEEDLEKRLARVVALLSSYDGGDLDLDIEEFARCEVENEDPLKCRLSDARTTMHKSKVKLPDWVCEAGGDERWKAWVERQVRRCGARAKKWARARGWLNAPKPSTGQWRRAIVEAIWASQGRGAYSQFPLSMAPPHINTDWNWPSVDHVDASNIANVAIETRLVNDVKGIMSEPELRSLVAHLAAALDVTPELQAHWSCRRSFAQPEQVLEPPLEGA